MLPFKGQMRGLTQIQICSLKWQIGNRNRAICFYLDYICVYPFKVILSFVLKSEFLPALCGKARINLGKYRGKVAASSRIKWLLNICKKAYSIEKFHHYVILPCQFILYLYITRSQKITQTLQAKLA